MNANGNSRSTLSLTSHQKDLLIIHLKGEVYELKQAENDYQSLQSQVQSLELRMRRLIEEKNSSIQDYEQIINGQQRDI